MSGGSIFGPGPPFPGVLALIISTQCTWLVYIQLMQDAFSYPDPHCYLRKDSGDVIHPQLRVWVWVRDNVATFIILNENE